jgi:formylglycine-generating enzyme required for sulfatase activity
MHYFMVDREKVRRQPVSDETRKPDVDEKRVRRGGSWSVIARNVRSAFRVGYGSSNRYANTGFRLVSGADKSEEATHE